MLSSIRCVGLGARADRLDDDDASAVADVVELLLVVAPSEAVTGVLAGGVGAGVVEVLVDIGTVVAVVVGVVVDIVVCR